MTDANSVDHGTGDRAGPEPERVVVRDRRRIDPLTGEVRRPEATSAASGAGGPGTQGRGAAPVEPPGGPAVTDPAAEAKLAELTAQLDERTADLQRVTAEYANYRRRVDRDREAITVAARAKVVGELLTVLDDLDRADTHGDLTGAFKAVADKLVSALTGIGLEAFGAEGDPFDPAVHEAVQHATSSEVAGPTVSVVLRKGYRVGERVLRPAMVVVTDREPGAPDLPT
ncbi:MAG: nucleotide exchange factor GrpE, partial [Pseudonocardia sp.]|nr:nucleotide exchange factor GrpE [Pseudonocardia sp.]